MNKDCNIILDLLPLYVDDILMPDTKEFVDEHLENCKNCRKELHILQEELINTQKIDSSVPLKTFKKSMKKNKILAIFLSVIFILSITLSAILITSNIKIESYENELASRNYNDWYSLLSMTEKVKDNIVTLDDVNQENFSYINTMINYGIRSDVNGISPDFDYGYYYFFGKEYMELFDNILYDRISEDEKQDALDLFLELNNALFDLCIYVGEEVGDVYDDRTYDLLNENSEIYKNISAKIEELCLEYHEKMTDKEYVK